MSHQMALITRVIDTGDLRTLRTYHIAPQALTDPDAQDALEYISYCYQTTGEIPSRQALLRSLPNVELVDHVDTHIDILCEHVAAELTEIGYRDLQLRSEDLLMQYTPQEAARKLAREFSALSAKFGKTPLYTVGSHADAEFERRISLDAMETSIPLPWKTLQHATLGIHGGEVFVFYGLKKQGKTFALLEIAEYMSWKGYRVLLISPAEMRASTLTDRTHAIRGQFPYREFRTRELFLGDSPAAEQNRLKLLQVITSFSEMKNFIIYDSGDDEATMSVDSVEGIIEEVTPDIVLIDQMQYIYMDGFSGYKELRHLLGAICKRLKKFSRKQDIPIILSTQANTEKEVGESSQIGQVVDAVIYVELYKKQGYRKFEVRAAREADVDDWYTAWEPCTNLAEIPYDDPRIQKSSSDTSPRRRRRKKPQDKLYERD
jgi:KaiC/GvpD/RAD55 family RecA-like ATPase